MPLPFLLLAFLPAQSAPPLMVAPVKSPEAVCIRAGDLPPAFARWNDAPAKTLSVGAPFVAAAGDPAALRWAVAPPADKAGQGAIAYFRIARAGLYRVGLSNGAWIDLVSGRQAIASVAHGHGPMCTGLRKIVDFRLAPGRYALQLAAMPAETTRVMIVPK